MSWPFRMVALIPCRAGSKRIPGKNTKRLNGHPLLAYTIAAAKRSGVFAGVYVCTDDAAAISFAVDSLTVVIPRRTVPDDQADIVWVKEALDVLGPIVSRPEAFAILRPTSPFRTADTIRRAFRQFTLPDQTADSIRAVREVTEHPGKMWAVTNGVMSPLLDYKRSDGVPWHSCPTQTLPTFYVQTSALEMAWTSNVETHGTISGRKVAPFVGSDTELLSLDYPDDWARAETLIAQGTPLPPVDVGPLSPAAPTVDAADSGRAVPLGTRL